MQQGFQCIRCRLLQAVLKLEFGIAAEQVELSREDYEHAIARIFVYEKTKIDQKIVIGAQKIVIGAGFLIAPGYVLTCAHVALQAMDIPEEEWDTHQNLEKLRDNEITLDFLSSKHAISAQIVALQAYNISQGDVAGLKLLEPAPEKANPIPIIRYTCAEIANDPHSVYGFANPSGDRSDAYKPKSNAAGGRFQFHKVGDPQDDTIASGFSGAPVWNEAKGCVVGMIATVRESAAKNQERRDKAYAIPEEQLDSTLQKLFAHSLYDLIEQGLRESRKSLQCVIDRAFWLCDEGRVKSDNLLGRLQDLKELPNREWKQEQRDVDRLTQFAMFLVVMDDSPKTLRQDLQDWVSFRGFNFDDLYRKANEERRDRKVSSAHASEHLVVQIKPDEQDKANVKVWIWVIPDRGSYDPLEPLQPCVKDKVILFDDLPVFLETWLEKKSSLVKPMVHCFVARHRLGTNLDARKNQEDLTLGSQYKLVMRTDLSQSPTGKQYYTRWRTKWEALESKQQSLARLLCVRSDCRRKGSLLKELKNAEIAILENFSNDRVEDVFEFLARKVGLPVVLWARQNEFSPDLDRLLDVPVIDLPERVYEERSGALGQEEENHLGYHLSLVWEDFKVIPPTMMMQLDQEAC